MTLRHAAATITVSAAAALVLDAAIAWLFLRFASDAALQYIFETEPY